MHAAADSVPCFQGAGSIDDVAAMCEHFNILSVGTTLSMQDKTLSMMCEPVGSAAENRNVCVVTDKIVPVAQSVTKENLNSGIFQLRDAPPLSAICQVTGSHTTLEHVTLKLASGDECQCLILERCDSVCFHDVHFRGALLSVWLIRWKREL